MAFLIKFVKGVRNHWKKSTFASIGLAYGAGYAKDYYETQQLMRAYCEKAAVFGKVPIPVDVNPRTITVILNPNANRRKAVAQFEKYCAPILYLAGACVDVIQTDSEGHAKKLMETLETTDAVVVAGGDGTLSEVVTGLLRREGTLQLPIGVLPLGRNNSVGKHLFPGGQKLQNVRSLADASLAVVEEFTKPVDIMKIEVLDEENITEVEGKPVYAVAGIRWGAYRDAESKKDKYWYYGPLRNYATYIFNGYKKDLTWNCDADISYSLPCGGCANCCISEAEVSKKKWYQRLIPYGKAKPIKQNPTFVNFQCAETHCKTISTPDMSLLTTNVSYAPTKDDNLPKLMLNLGPDSINYFDFVSEGWQTEKGNNRSIKEVIEARQIEIKPKVTSKEKNEKWFSIDNENYEVKPVRITLLPKVIKMFCKKEDVKM